MKRFCIRKPVCIVQSNVKHMQTTRLSVNIPAVSPIIGVLAFLIVNLPFAFLDLTGRPRTLLKYKIQEEKPVPVSVMFFHVNRVNFKKKSVI